MTFCAITSLIQMAASFDDEKASCPFLMVEIDP